MKQDEESEQHRFSPNIDNPQLALTLSALMSFTLALFYETFSSEFRLFLETTLLSPAFLMTLYRSTNILLKLRALHSKTHKTTTVMYLQIKQGTIKVVSQLQLGHPHKTAAAPAASSTILTLVHISRRALGF